MSYQFVVSVLSDRHLCHQSIVSVSSVCCQSVVSVLSVCCPKQLFVREHLFGNSAVHAYYSIQESGQFVHTITILYDGDYHAKSQIHQLCFIITCWIVYYRTSSTHSISLNTPGSCLNYQLISPSLPVKKVGTIKLVLLFSAPLWTLGIV